MNTGIENSGNRNSGNRNSGHGNSGDRNSGDWNSGDRNSGNWNSGDWNSGNWNSGHFNTNEPKLRMFNRDTEMTRTEFIEKYGYFRGEFKLNTWIEQSQMTDDEKKTVTGWETMGGYLKTLSYKEAWAEMWKNCKQDVRDWYLSLPNFDAAIFKEITGIDVEKKDTAAEEAIKLLKEKGYRIVKD